MKSSTTVRSFVQKNILWQETKSLNLEVRLRRITLFVLRYHRTDSAHFMRENLYILIGEKSSAYYDINNPLPRLYLRNKMVRTKKPEKKLESKSSMKKDVYRIIIINFIMKRNNEQQVFQTDSPSALD